MEKKNSKNKFDLSTDMITIETIDTAPSNVTIPNSTIKITKGTQSPIGKVKLTLSVPEDFVPDYKSWCIKHKRTMSDGIVEALKLLKQKYGY